jgi:HPt (histidine-containing phosphotransfer) domain-containing protein
MAIDIPDWLEPVLNLYGIPWPDVDEDAFHNLKGPLHNFGQDLNAVSDAIETALRQLEAGNPSQTLRSIVTYVQAIRRDFLDPINGVCADLAGWPCDLAYDVVVSAKVTLLGMLTGEITNDVVDIVGDILTLGLATALTTSEAIAVREAVSQALSLLEADAASTIASAANGYLESFVSSLVNPFIDDVARNIEGAVDTYNPTFVFRQAFGAEQGALDRLHLSPSELESCVHAIHQSTSSLDSAAQALTAAIDEIFSHPASSPWSTSLSSDFRTALKGVVSTVKTDLVQGVRNLIEAVANHFATLLEDYRRDIQDLDAQARATAGREHAAAGAPIVVFSAAGIAISAAAGVTATSGLFDTEESESVQVEAVTAEAMTGESITYAETGPSPTPISGTPTGAPTVDPLHNAPPKAAKMADVAGSGPHSTDSTDSVHVHHPDGHQPDPTGSASPQSTGHELHVKESAGALPRLGRPESTAHGVREFREAGKGEPESVIDNTPTHVESE